MNLDSLGSNETVDGRGSRPVWALHPQVLRELAQHAGHADILREQILESRARAFVDDPQILTTSPDECPAGT